VALRRQRQMCIRDRHCFLIKSARSKPSETFPKKDK
jgi:hypothetical protein